MSLTPDYLLPIEELLDVLAPGWDESWKRNDFRKSKMTLVLEAILSIHDGDWLSDEERDAIKKIMERH